MRLTTKGRYAVTAMLDLAIHANQGPVSLADISTRQEISLSYLEQLFAKLRRNELVKSVRGPGGGSGRRADHGNHPRHGSAGSLRDRRETRRSVALKPLRCRQRSDMAAKCR